MPVTWSPDIDVRMDNICRCHIDYFSLSSPASKLMTVFCLSTVHLREQTPVKVGTSTVRSAIVTRSTPRKRLILTDTKEVEYQTPDKSKPKVCIFSDHISTQSQLIFSFNFQAGSPSPKRSRVERVAKNYSGTLGSALKGLSQEQLIEVIQNMVKKHPNLENVRARLTK